MNQFYLYMKDYNRGFGIIRHNSPKVAANDLYTYESKLFCEPSTMFKGTTIFIPCTFSSWRLRVYKQYNVVSIEFVCWNKDLFVCTCTCCDKNGGKVADYFKIMAQLKLTLT